jgi:hypothetical protein
MAEMADAGSIYIAHCNREIAGKGHNPGALSNDHVKHHLIHAGSIPASIT